MPASGAKSRPAWRVARSKAWLAPNTSLKQLPAPKKKAMKVMKAMKATKAMKVATAKKTKKFKYYSYFMKPASSKAVLPPHLARLGFSYVRMAVRM
jgi:hypothetical protein